MTACYDRPEIQDWSYITVEREKGVKGSFTKVRLKFYYIFYNVIFTCMHALIRYYNLRVSGKKKSVLKVYDTGITKKLPSTLGAGNTVYGPCAQPYKIISQGLLGNNPPTTSMSIATAALLRPRQDTLPRVA
jgi:hypothetical protein